MEHDRTELMPIGAFAEGSRLSLKALRLYDRLGLLTPAYVDPDSGYRYYVAEQLRSAWLVMRMRQLGMPLETIKGVLAAEPDVAVEVIASFWTGVEQRMEKGRRALEDVRRALLKLEVSMNIVIEQRSLAPQPIASITSRVTIDTLPTTMKESLATLRRTVGMGVGPAFSLFHGPVNPESDGPIEICIPIAEEGRYEGVEVKTLPGGTAVATTLTGDQCDFPAIIQAYDTLADWIHSHGHQMAGPPREVYLDEPNETTRPEDQMEIVWLYT
jgi:DNA-binding transcriptional MerR regulator